MFDMSPKFNTFYKSYVVLPQHDQDELHKKKEINIQRLKAGLKEYNTEFKTSYSIVETCVQGSVAMATVVQNESNEYDIDVAVVFNKSDLGDIGARAARNIVANALNRKTKQFNAVPEIKTSCVRVKYSDSYHIDFAVFRRTWNDVDLCWKYEHAGVDWSERELRGISEWFKDKNDLSEGKLRRVIRLSKMFCKSRDSWINMPSGLIQTVLCEERLQVSYTRIDELFYYTMKEIVSRLESNTTVTAPVDNGRNLTPRKSDTQKIVNWKNRLKSKLEDLDVLFKDDCSEEDALQAWYGFFNHEYWSKQIPEKSRNSLATNQDYAVKFYTDTEQYIEDLYPISIHYNVDLECTVSGDGWRANTPLSSFLSVLQRYVPHGFSVKCSVKSTTTPAPYDVLWKVKNVGPVAQRRNDVRGQILPRGNSITEHTTFYGNHYIECYIIKDGYCVARKLVPVPIGRR